MIRLVENDSSEMPNTLILPQAIKSQSGILGVTSTTSHGTDLQTIRHQQAISKLQQPHPAQPQPPRTIHIKQMATDANVSPSKKARKVSEANQ